MLKTIIILALVAGIATILTSRRGRKVLRKQVRVCGEAVAGICATAMDNTVRKGANKRKILDLLAKEESAGNAEIAEALKVSPRTVVRYMDELEREGKVMQEGEIGRSVIYRLKSSDNTK